MVSISKTKAVSLAAALSFAGAAALLVFHGAGPLRIPGIAAAVAATITAATGYPLVAGMVGVISASVSFVAQARFGLCLDCAVAASCFAAGGLLSGAALYHKRPLVPVVFALCLIGSMGVFIYSMNKVALPVVASALQTTEETTKHPTGPPPITDPDRSAGMAELFFSPWCKYCGEAVAAFVRADPEGRLWRPVVVPEAAASEGEKELRDLGYTGVVSVAHASPSSGVPSVRLPDGRVVTGSGKVMQFVPNIGK
ncbi:MAG: hypothetical protein ACPLSY_04750 [Moorellaceae bacterium]